LILDLDADASLRAQGFCATGRRISWHTRSRTASRSWTAGSPDQPRPTHRSTRTLL